MTKSEEYRELLIRELKATGECIKENAENIAVKGIDPNYNFSEFGAISR